MDVTGSGNFGEKDVLITICFCEISRRNRFFQVGFMPLGRVALG